MTPGTPAQVALLGPSGRRTSPPRLRSEAAAEMPLVRLAAFAALGLYGVLRWSTLLAGRAEGRLLALLALALLVAGCGMLTQSRLLATVAALLAALAGFAIAGVPLAWVLHLRVAVTARAIGDGLSGIPGALVPYAGGNRWVRTVIVLGAGVLLFDGAFLLAFAPRALGELRRAGAALPMVALAAVPATLVHPRFPYLDGLVLFALLGGFIWGERLRRDGVGAAVALCGVAAVAGMIVAPTLDRHKPWLNYQALAGGLARANVEAFDWSQNYGPIHWPRRGHGVLEVQASRGEYWKAENLDVFDGRGWVGGSSLGASDPIDTVSAAASRRWTQTLHVTIGAMSTSDVIASGLAYQPSRLPGAVVAGRTPGTWMTPYELGPGDSYSVKVYVPHPSPAQLARAGTRYPEALLPGYLTLTVPEPATQSPSAGAGVHVASPVRVSFPAFGSRLGTAASGAERAGPANALKGSPYAAALDLARRLARQSSTPYAYVTAVANYLAHGYTYNESPPVSRYPLETFLFASKQGYCQQFAGAMALLLRMGGVPARVAAGFTEGNYDSASKRWVVSDLDAHAWVEAWFPRYGWVGFDPTPPQDPALGGRTPIASGAGAAGSAAAPHPSKRLGVGSGALAGASPGRAASSRGGSAVSPLEVVAIVAGIAMLGALALGTRPLARGEVMVAELERALARCRRPLSEGATLAGLERSLGTTSEAAAYVRALRLQRFAGAGEPPTPRQRRALRAHLGAGLGPLGRLRAAWALPPRRLRAEAPAEDRQARRRDRANA